MKLWCVCCQLIFSALIMYLIFIILLIPFVSAIRWDFDFDGDDTGEEYRCSKVILISMHFNRYASALSNEQSMLQTSEITGDELFGLETVNGTFVSFKTAYNTYIQTTPDGVLQAPMDGKSNFTAQLVSPAVYIFKANGTSSYIAAGPSGNLAPMAQPHPYEHFKVVCVGYSVV